MRLSFRQGLGWRPRGPIGIGIDISGNVWAVNNPGLGSPAGSLTEMIGAAGPVLTPLMACLTHSTPSAVCLP